MNTQRPDLPPAAGHTPRTILADPDLLKEVFSRSKQLTLQTYDKPIFKDTDFMDYLHSYKKAPLLNKTQETIFRCELHLVQSSSVRDFEGHICEQKTKTRGSFS